ARPLSEAMALRYQVYCEEFEYLPAGDYPAGLECDEDDSRAAHFHLFDRRTLDASEPTVTGWDGSARGALAGYVRLVRPDAHDLLPVQRRCQLTLDDGARPTPSLSAEVSRLITAPEFRRNGRNRSSGRQASGQTSDTQLLPTEILLHLFRQMLSYSRSNGIRYWFAAMERPLARSLSQMGFPFKAAGPEGEFFGRVTPYVADLNDLQHRVATSQPGLAPWLLAPEVEDGHFPDTTPSSFAPVWARRPPPPQLWRAAC
ncbi:MAG: GNAT family N-acyltransferase, partial [Rubrivivax sp.]|nr:GNAT family N-acyltransferase [Rubrivivax sp.]